MKQRLDEGILSKWDRAAAAVGIQPESYNIRARVLGSPNEPYRFGVILNEHRAKRPDAEKVKTMDCPLCNAVERAIKEPDRSLLPIESNAKFVFIPNLFPLVRGASLAVARGTGPNERAMYTTKDIHPEMASELSELIGFTKRTGFNLFHNSPGAGASIYRHEHYQLVDFGPVYDLAGARYGFDGAEKSNVVSCRGVKVMPGFPFEHLIFDQNDPERVVSFLTALGSKFEGRFSQGFVPHVLCQGKSDDLLVMPIKKIGPSTIGAGDAAGHLTFYEEREFIQATPASCLARLREYVFGIGEINLRSLV